MDTQEWLGQSRLRWNGIAGVAGLVTVGHGQEWYRRKGVAAFGEARNGGAGAARLVLAGSGGVSPERLGQSRAVWPGAESPETLGKAGRRWRGEVAQEWHGDARRGQDRRRRNVRVGLGKERFGTAGRAWQGQAAAVGSGIAGMAGLGTPRSGQEPPEGHG